MLTQKQQNMLASLVAVLIPTDDIPGATEAGVSEYLQQQLQGDLSSQVSLYQNGLDAVENESTAHYNRPFAQLDPGEKRTLLHRIEIGDLKDDSDNRTAPHFLNTVAEHAAEGFYINPISWKMIGFEVTG